MTAKTYTEGEAKQAARDISRRRYEGRRRSGRTTKAVELAVELAKSGADVAYVVHADSFAEHVWHIASRLVPFQAGRFRDGTFTRRALDNVTGAKGTFAVVTTRQVSKVPIGTAIIYDHVARGEW